LGVTQHVALHRAKRRYFRSRPSWDRVAGAGNTPQCDAAQNVSGKKDSTPRFAGKRTRLELASNL